MARNSSSVGRKMLAPLRGCRRIRPIASRCRSASRTGVREVPNSAESAASSIGSPGFRRPMSIQESSVVISVSVCPAMAAVNPGTAAL